jgi:FdhD protein
MNNSVAHVPVQRVLGAARVDVMDALAVEEPLEIQLEHAGRRRSLSITMRTPGHDQELALGFLWTEGILRGPEDLLRVRSVSQSPCRTNLVRVALQDHVAVDLDRLERHFYTTSSCGVCGKASIQALRTQSAYPPWPEGSPPFFPASLLYSLPARLRAAQEVFAATGGLHASALFDPSGECLVLREDVGRHNALDKVIGRALLDGRLPLRDRLLLVSGRASFELVQKASMAGLPFLGAVGAPSSLAVDLAREAGMTLVGWLRDGRFNVYTGTWRLT